LLKHLHQTLLLLGIPGLFAISFLDSAAIPLPGGPDAVVMLLSWQRPALLFLVVLVASLGSTLGCLVLHSIGEKAGEKALSRFNPDKRSWAEGWMQKKGLWAIVASVLAPPPFPTKLVVLAAGVLRTGQFRFCMGVFTGRLVRYSLMGFLAARFGSEATQILKHYYPAISLALIGCILIFLLLRNFRGRSKPAPTANPR
jgi:membrane protein YqaA with SNARE-associated domain